MLLADALGVHVPCGSCPLQVRSSLRICFPEVESDIAVTPFPLRMRLPFSFHTLGRFQLQYPSSPSRSFQHCCLVNYRHRRFVRVHSLRPAFVVVSMRFQICWVPEVTLRLPVFPFIFIFPPRLPFIPSVRFPFFRTKDKSCVVPKCVCV